MLREAAELLRNAIQEAEVTDLPEEISIEDLEKGEVQVPAHLNEFLKYLLAGERRKSWECTNTQQKIKSISQDLVSAVKKSKHKLTSKHIKLGMFIKSVTGSKKTVTLLNKMGHCASYNTIEEIETEMTYTARKNKDMLPTGMKKDSSTLNRNRCCV